MESAQLPGEGDGIERDEIRAAVAAQLGIEATDIADEDDLIQLGLDSIRTMKLAGGWRKRGIDVNFAQLAATPTVADWLRMLGGTADSAAPADGTPTATGSASPAISAGLMAAGGTPTKATGGGPTATSGAFTAAGGASVASGGTPTAGGGPMVAGGTPTATSCEPMVAGGATVSADRTPAAIDDTSEAVADVPAVTDDGSPFPLAPMQHAYWIGRSAEQRLGEVAAHLYIEFDGGAVDPERLGAAVAALVQRHPMLRTRFRPDGQQQTLAAPGRPVWSVTDLRQAAAAEVDATLESLRHSRTHQRLAVEEGQVVDIAATLLPGDRTRLHLDVDMLAADAMSYRVLIADLARLYRGETLPPVTYTFREYLADPGGRATAGERERARRWWQERLPELPGAPELPRSAATETGNSTVRHHHWLPPAEKARVFATAHARGVTPAMALASIFADTIGGWSAQRRFLLNLPLFHREPVHPEVGGVVGDFTSSVLLEVDVTEPATVFERAAALQRRMHAAGAHSAYSGLEVLRDLGRSRGEPVLAPIVYTSALNLGELFADVVTETFGDPVWIISQGPQVLLDAQVTEVRGGLLLNWDVRATAFPPGMVETMFDGYLAAITALATESPEPGTGWDTAAGVRLPAEQARIRARANATDGPVSGRTLHTGFFTHAAAEPDAPALIWESTDRTHRQTYGELAAEALTVAGALRAAGVRPGDAVAVQLPKGPDQVVATLGVLAAGAVYVPIGADQPSARRAEILRVGDVVAAITAAETIAALPTLTLAAARIHPQPLPEPVFPDPEQISYVLFTSGSTGVPKGVEVPHRAAMNTIDDLNDRFAIGPADRALALSALEFDLSVYDLFGLFSAGGAVVAVDAAQRSEPARWVELITRHRISVLNCVPSLLDMVLTAAGDIPLDSLRAVLLGGDWVDVALPGRLAAVAPGCRFAGLGGATETAIHSTVCEVAGARVPQDWKAIPYGTPLRNVRCRVVDPAGQDCPDWVTGELWIGGAGVAAGYRNEPERTADRFVEYAGLRWYRTGDLARYRPDGILEFFGRADHQVKLRGYRVELGEVESALRALPGVRHAVAAVIGSAAPKLAAVVVAADGMVLPPDETLGVLAELLPDYMVPSRLAVLPRLPLTPNGKPDRRAVLALLAESAAEHEFVAARTDVERALADIVAAVLQRAEVGVTDDFFALGGDSVLATTVVARVREWLDVPGAVVSDLFATRTVAGLAQRLSQREPAGRLDTVAGLYLEVAAMSDDEVVAATR
ncbi:non-ribosomal peptide synthetase [Nocardia sp. BMG111209]|uniref:non-ribosomal peptide synthetase n=1 Tax=Nocardia sp. BMG111209 TaxID=1160137 RepID=UPI000364FCDE|nr:non-ribosomal peptide synthetase [Nocardia sp. BMG111209]